MQVVRLVIVQRQRCLFPVLLSQDAIFKPIAKVLPVALHVVARDADSVAALGGFVEDSPLAAHPQSALTIWVAALLVFDDAFLCAAGCCVQEGFGLGADPSQIIVPVGISLEVIDLVDFALAKMASTWPQKVARGQIHLLPENIVSRVTGKNVLSFILQRV